jgi:hypothetical protein
VVVPALEALVGADASGPLIDAALATIPAAELPDALQGFVRAHGAETLAVLARCLHGRPEWVTAGAAALVTLATPAAADVLRAAERALASKTARAVVRRALYRLRQGGIAPVEPPPPDPGPAARPISAWMSAVDGTGTRGVWLVLEGPLGAHTLVRAAVSDLVGLLDGAADATAKKRAEAELATLRAQSPFPWVAAPPEWVWWTLWQALGVTGDLGSRRPGVAAIQRVLGALGPPPATPRPPIQGRLATETLDGPGLLEGSAALLELPECAGWFLDPAAVQAEALDRLQAQESRLVVSDAVKAERGAALVDRVIDAQLGDAARRRWAARLDEQAFVFLESARPAQARMAVAVARALVDPARTPHRLPFVRALVERSLAIAGDVALGKVPAEQVRREPRVP